ncbi:MAG: acyltransferase [Sellimonas intestinalis]
MDGSGKVIIENDVSISCFAKIISCTHSTRSEIFEYKTNPIWIKNNVWIATEAIILDNSIIEEKAIIGSGSIFKGKPRVIAYIMEILLKKLKIGN